MRNPKGKLRKIVTPLQSAQKAKVYTRKIFFKAEHFSVLKILLRSRAVHILKVKKNNATKESLTPNCFPKVLLLKRKLSLNNTSISRKSKHINIQNSPTNHNIEEKEIHAIADNIKSTAPSHRFARI